MNEDMVERVALALWRIRDSRMIERVRRPEPDKLDRASGAWQIVINDARAAIAAVFEIVPE